MTCALYQEVTHRKERRCSYENRPRAIESVMRFATSTLDTIANESERLTRLLNNVLDFSRIESGRKTYHFASHDLESIVRSAMHYPLARQGFELRVQIGEGIPPVRGDADALRAGHPEPAGQRAQV